MDECSHPEIRGAGECADQIEALFPAFRCTIGDECSAYVQWLTGNPEQPIDYAVFITVAGGSPKEATSPVADGGPLEAQIASTVEFVKAHWPERDQLKLLWRQPPVVEHQAAQRASRRHGLPSRPPRTYLYMRLAAVPLHIDDFIPRR